MARKKKRQKKKLTKVESKDEVAVLDFSWLDADRKEREELSKLLDQDAQDLENSVLVEVEEETNEIETDL